MSLSKQEVRGLDLALSLTTTSVDSFFKLRKISKGRRAKILRLTQFFLYCIMYKQGLMNKALKELSSGGVDRGLSKTVMEIQGFIDRGILQVGDFELLCASLSVTVVMSDMD